MDREKLPISIRVTVKSHSKNLLDALFGIIKVTEVGIELELDLLRAHNWLQKVTWHKTRILLVKLSMVKNNNNGLYQLKVDVGMAKAVKNLSAFIISTSTFSPYNPLFTCYAEAQKHQYLLWLALQSITDMYYLLQTYDEKIVVLRVNESVVWFN